MDKSRIISRFRFCLVCAAITVCSHITICHAIALFYKPRLTKPAYGQVLVFPSLVFGYYSHCTYNAMVVIFELALLFYAALIHDESLRTGLARVGFINIEASSFIQMLTLILSYLQP